MDERIEQFRTQVEAHFGGRPGPGARYPEQLRLEAATVARAALSGGASLRAILWRLRVGAGTLKGRLDFSGGGHRGAAAGGEHRLRGGGEGSPALAQVTRFG